jgi:uncharacterized protein (TIGR03118 family)
MWFRKLSLHQDSKARGGILAAPRRSPKFGPRVVEALEDRALMSRGGLDHHMPPPPHTFFTQTNLVSDIQNPTPGVDGMPQIIDTNLVNSWGLVAAGPSGPWWINDNGAGVSTVYSISTTRTGQTVSKAPLTVTIPPPTSTPTATATPTGIVFNNTDDFRVNGSPATFIFDTEDGTISAWNSKAGTNAVLEVDNPSAPDGGAVYKGLALGTAGGANFLYATNFRAGTIDVFDKNFAPHTFFAGQFTDPNLPAGFAPFGIANISGLLFVTYAKQDAAKHDDVAGLGNGFVDVFNTSGDLLGRFASGGKLNSPWGLALAPKGFGQFGGDLLVGNFGDGHINAFKIQFNPAISGQFVGQLSNSHRKPITIDGLWGLAFGNGGMAGSTNTLFFTAGINDEADGLFGSLTVTANHHRDQ